ncbi:variable surface protein [Plasmodium gonderi]|uniref:Variable surface protein n=1 Tax=Plasmodium gonderi TaxID=77519 RepID=A0A1Y1JWT8_PLAGO|nr:variable surface protein [Plasmodium gonderi]GAW84284.1 variable surface protein [Plasmodium gonderi]
MDLVEYTIVKHFPEYNKNIENYDKNLTFPGDPCTIGSIKATGILNDIFNVDKCKTALSFASKIKGDPYDPSTRISCFYLYYWLHKLFNESSISNKTNSIYQKLIYIVNDYGSHMCRDYMNFAISEDELKKLNDLNDMNNMLYYVINSYYPTGKNKCDCLVACLNIYEQHNKTCKLRNQSFFCEALDDIKDQYNKLSNLTNECVNFTPYNSRLHRGMRDIIDKLSRHKDDSNVLENSETSSITSWNSSYNILYNST